MPAIKAIETRCAGCRFRSRLEARWAVFFDHLGIAWEYEPEGFELPSGRYLPDFWLPEMVGKIAEAGVWFEVKNDAYDYDPRWDDLARLSTHTVVVGRSIPRHAEGMDLEVLWRHDDDDLRRDAEHTFCDCLQRYWRVEYGPESGYHRSNHPRVELALIAARSARFEHGEIGQTGPAAKARIALGAHRRAQG